MRTPLTPLDFMRRARRLYADREAVVDGDLRLTYDQFSDRCGRWSAALQGLGIGKGDRVAYIAPNTHAQLESFYAVPQLGAVLVPINYRLISRRLRVHHQPLRRAHRVRACGLPRRRRSIREQLPNVEHFVALEGAKKGWLDYERTLAAAPAEPPAAADRRDRSAHDQLHERHDGAAQRRDDHPPQRVHERGRHAGPRAHDPRRPLSLDAADVPRQRLDVRWTVTAVGGTHVCLRKVEAGALFALIERRKHRRSSAPRRRC